MNDDSRGEIFEFLWAVGVTAMIVLIAYNATEAKNHAEAMASDVSDIRQILIERMPRRPYEVDRAESRF